MYIRSLSKSLQPACVVSNRDTMLSHLTKLQIRTKHPPVECLPQQPGSLFQASLKINGVSESYLTSLYLIYSATYSLLILDTPRRMK